MSLTPWRGRAQVPATKPASIAAIPDDIPEDAMAKALDILCRSRQHAALRVIDDTLAGYKTAPNPTRALADGLLDVRLALTGGAR